MPLGTRHSALGTLTSLLQHFLDVPAFPLRQRAALFDHHAIADVEVGTLVVREELARPLDVLLVAAVLHEILDRDDDRLLHLVRHDDADLLVFPRLFLFLFGHRLMPSTSRSTMFGSARSRGGPDASSPGSRCARSRAGSGA